MSLFYFRDSIWLFGEDGDSPRGSVTWENDPVPLCPWSCFSHLRGTEELPERGLGRVAVSDTWSMPGGLMQPWSFS